MAAINFPDSPTDGEPFEHEGITWVYASGTNSWNLEVAAGGIGATGPRGLTGAQGYTGPTGPTGPMVMLTAAYTGPTTLQLSDASKAVEINSGSSATVTVPTDASVAFPEGTIIEIFRRGSGAVSIAGASGVTIRNLGGGALTAQYSTASLRKTATANEWVLVGQVT